MHIRQTLSQSRPAWRAHALFALTLAALMLLPAVALAQTPPAAPLAVTVTHNGSNVDASWDAVSGATKYHVTYSFNNKTSWVAASCADNCTSNSYTVTAADPGKTYIVAVRAGNSDGWSSWVNSAPAAPSNPPPAAPSTVTITRADGTLTVSGYAVAGATKYHITYSSNNKQSWSGPPCADNCAGTGITISGVDNAKSYIVAVRAGNAAGWSVWVNAAPAGPLPLPPSAPAKIWVNRVCDHTMIVWWDWSDGATGYDLVASIDHRQNWKRLMTDKNNNGWQFSAWQKEKTFWFGVRARNAHGESAWTNSAAAPPPPCEVGNLRTVTRTVHGQAGGRITATWDAAKRAGAYNVNHRLNGGEWTRIASNGTSTSHTWSVAESGSHVVAVQSVAGSLGSQWQNAGVAWLTAGSITATTATLTVAGHSGDWYYKATAAPDSTCRGPVSATTKDLTSLIANNSYTYTAYTDSGCANAIGSATFTTPGVSVSNLSEASDGIGRTVLLSDLEANAFTTGDHSSGYTLDRVVIKFRTSINPGGDLTAAIHTVSGGDPAASATYTLSGNSDPATAGDYTYTCSGTCTLNKDTTYFLVLSGTSLTHSLGYHLVDTTTSDIETNTPSDAGWEIANTAKYNSGNTWTDEATPASIMFKVVATKNPILSASGVTTSGATLTITEYSAQWWYKANIGPHATCQGPVAANSSNRSLTGLTAGTSYTYSAYSDSACTTVIATAAEFTAGSVSVSNMSETSDGIGRTVLLSDLEANAFTTGDHSSGYTLHRVVIKFRTSINPGGDLTAAIHAESSGDPAASATYTLSGNSDPATAGDYTYTCSGTCTLNKDTTYFLVLSGTSLTHSLGYHLVDTTTSDIETNTPSDAGWEIANTAKYNSGNTWTDEATPASIMFEVFAAAKP